MKCLVPNIQQILRAAIAAAKFLFDAESIMSDDSLPYTDIPVIKALRKLAIEAAKKEKIAPPASNFEVKWVSWPGTIF